ncbi:hypothetical protein AMS69_10165 [Haloarcula rubripromontorii]|uniref:Uncharacterized protein n=1 Tax=Haloarcula rubripromontorii TaxID=1705562 RepID=A0A0N0BNQ1_9EURY|nr:hypothetical protein [Haloarcula rubripromontorii]KOX92816.1 hypothetical protein AMS69_10165 [Haloarcula rubripromontorii]
MSSDPSLDLGDGSGQESLSGVTNFLQDGGDAGKVLSASIIGLIVSPVVAVIDVVNAVANFFAQPFDNAGDAIGSLLTGLFEAPGNLLTAGADISETALRSALGETLAGTLAFPITVGIVMLALYLVVRYLREDETGDVLPGLPIDVPTDIFGVEEEDTIDE